MKLAINRTQRFVSFDEAMGPASDFIWVVDQSKNMESVHKWLPQANALLDSTLINASLEQGLNSNVANLFGLVGFGGADLKNSKGVAIAMPTGELFGTREQFQQSAKKLSVDGQFKDGYNALLVALSEFRLRHGAACHVLLVSDEGRASVGPQLDFQMMAQSLRSANCLLHVVVEELFEGGVQAALGMTSSNSTYLQLPNGQFLVRKSSSSPALPSSADSNTHEAYVKLAIATGGSAWTVDKIRNGNQTAVSLTRALSSFISGETIARLCQQCTCQSDGQVTCKPCRGELSVKWSRLFPQAFTLLLCIEGYS